MRIKVNMDPANSCSYCAKDMCDVCKDKWFIPVYNSRGNIKDFRKKVCACPCNLLRIIAKLPEVPTPSTPWTEKAKIHPQPTTSERVQELIRLRKERKRDH